ncbi:MAG: hypothetical protein KDB88_10320 [Flavobacteriales bacterium]|nr:hypothetical protein [Flavobacteriales bacterium]
MRDLFRHSRSSLVLLMLSLGCQEPPEQSEPYKQLAEDQRRTEALVAERDSSINALFGSFNRISENLREIRERQGAIGRPTENGEAPKDMEEQIASDLAAIETLLDENKALIAAMRKQAKADGGTMAELQKTILELERSVSEKDSEIGILKEQLASTNSSLATLIEMYRDKEQLTDLQRDELNKAYYAVGTTKELREKGVLTTEGGFVGLGKVSKLNTSGMDASYFEEVDITKLKMVPVGARKARLVTNHPEGSYSWEGTFDSLVIEDAERFWSVSKYLVIEVG